MTEVLIFHHAQGLTGGCLEFADQLRSGGHVVHTPDLYDGKTFDKLNDGVNHVDNEIGMDAIIERGRAAAEDLPSDIVYAGLSLGAMPAQSLAQNRAGCLGALLIHGCAELSWFGGSWPEGVPMQMHTMDADEWVELGVARDLEATIEGAELFLYPGDGHLFTDNSLDDYDPAAAALVTERVLTFLDEVD